MPSHVLSASRLSLLILGIGTSILIDACGDSSTPPTNGNTGGTGGTGAVVVVDEVVAQGLTNPWAMAFAPDGRMFFTEQPGRIRMLNAQFQLASQPVYDITSAVPGGEAGMLGLALDPSFATNHLLFVFHCLKGPPLECRIDRLVESNNTAQFDQTLFSYFPTNNSHIGGRLKIGPDNLLYLTSGDWMNAANAQDLSNVAGKILRFNLDGSAASGNPFPTAPFVYTFGNRDAQGLAFDSNGQLYETEHGPISNDEVNIVRAGGNYGYPVCVGVCNNPQFIDPLKVFSPETAPPSGATFYTASQIPQWNGSLFFAVLGLAGNDFAHHLHRLKFNQAGGTSIVEEEVLYRGKYGRIRDVVQGPDGALYFCSANGSGSDVIVRARAQ